MNWSDKAFDELTNYEVFQLLKLRAVVFNTEQQSAVYDPDDHDPQARHLLCKDGDQLVAYARYFVDGDHVTFGRVVIAQDYRGTGLSAPLMDRLLAGIKAHFPGKEIIIHAQYYIRGYYAKYGFQPFGDTFIEAARKHIQMKHPAL
ncbi:GNAT family N-acetyltransferase [Limosilactobacillus sp.]|uniref:GNAT family N-acetyltransferase n=1 Tax=Limosilactobacillus sp. TaxID=2773925 RepID=UPI003F100913